jgi:hypothetical protein
MNVRQYEGSAAIAFAPDASLGPVPGPVKVDLTTEDAVVRLLEGGPGQRAVVEMTSPVANNPIYRAYRALRALRVQIMHTEVRAMTGRLVQKLHLAERDGRALDERRISDVLNALRKSRSGGLEESDPPAAVPVFAFA